MSSSLLFSLPPEVRYHIFNHALPIRRLAAQHITDHEWTRLAHEERGVPDCLFTCKQFYKDAAPLFYSKATLEVAPIPPSRFALESLTSLGYTSDLAFSLNNIFSFCSMRHLRCIRTVHVFTGQRDAINAESYEAMLGWLIANTGVTSIYLSFRLMTRLRKSRIDVDALGWVRSRGLALRPSRTIHIYTNSKRSPWEQLRRLELKKALQHRFLPELQIYMVHQTLHGEPTLDPRWDVRKNDEDDHFRIVDGLSTIIDGLTSMDTTCIEAQDDDWIHECNGFTRLYQVIFVFSPG